MGRMSRKNIKEQATAIRTSKTLKEAYMKTHNCNELTAEKHGYKMLQHPEILAELEKQMDKIKPVEVNKQNIIKLLTLVINNWQEGNERTSDFLRTIELLSKLVPEFIDRQSVTSYEKMSPDQLNKEIAERLKTLNIPNQN